MSRVFFIKNGCSSAEIALDEPVVPGLKDKV
jgi:hypothetical protein